IGLIGLYLGFYFELIFIIILSGVIIITSISMLILLKRTSPLQTTGVMIIIRKHPMFKPVKINIDNIIKIEKHKYYRAIIITFRNDKNEIKNELFQIFLLKEKDILIFNKFIRLFDHNFSM
ncbi:MAG: hypothetical protein KAJ51_11885, partial [Thermoplasmata archaeon]|nr:hypothetical protein [Thermoplasmata archaeon]